MGLFAFGGTHVLSDISGIPDDVVADHDLILGAIARGIRTSGATLCGMQVKEFEPAGMTAIYLLSESHVSVHTYPESNALFLDAFTCGETCRPELILDELLAALGRCDHRTSTVHRGTARPRHAIRPVEAPVLAAAR
ncbi:adenosylmethionine decarboxylase [Nakamurella sp. YIM 132087]|uniref:Adenosylmethionine decarboxylase n=1 Tax=Nakamurella alba TaxID=2665158 RepID=A0A7K1FQN2_9ACTN|nr:adenosylmethionine decarboxylase [Nakamurella alba]MTD15669.1 adenosylmethionine decarboxylase [Nakamurella alba]